MNDGGPAFPLHIMEPHGDFANDTRLPGLSLRDWFAGQALAGWVNQGTIVASEDQPCNNAAKWCYAMADAMLKAREAKS